MSSRLQSAALFEQWQLDEQICGLRAGVEALKLKNECLRAAMVREPQLRVRLAEMAAEKLQLKSRAAQLKLQLQAHQSREQRIMEALEF